jgi:hypothetical protein
MLPDGDDDARLDKQLRKAKVEALLRDFNNEIESRIRSLEMMKTEMMRQIDLAYTMELMQIKPEHRSMKLVDYLAMMEENEDGARNKPSIPDVSVEFMPSCKATSNISTYVSQLKTESDGMAAGPTTSRKTRKTKKADEMPAGQQTVRRGRARKASSSLMTPAVQPHPSSTLMMTTPMVLPKFDPKLYQTPAVLKRVPKPDEVVMSIDGSPILMSSTEESGTLDAFVVPIDKFKSIVVRDYSELSNLDPGMAQRAGTKSRRCDGHCALSLESNIETKLIHVGLCNCN